MRYVISGTVLALTLTACGGEGEPTAQETVTQTVTPEPTSATPTATPTTVQTPEPEPMIVSLSTTCELLFNDDPSPIDQAINLANATTIGDKQLRQAKDLSSELAFLRDSANAEVRPYIEETRQMAQVIIDAANSGAGTIDRDMQGFRAAGYELIDRCTPFIG